ncbi:MAG: hypothetical protein IJL89_02735 [Firmicutes bacterium]|nr:hypothetical protein [Bacillota bacterium]
MAYGAFNAGSGASTYDLDMLAGRIISGSVEAPLTAANGSAIATQDGGQILAYAVPPKQACGDEAVAFAVAGMVRMIEIFRNEYLAERSTLAADIIRGIVSAPLTTVDNNPICLSGGEPLLAYRVEEDHNYYADMAVKKAFEELSATVERYQSLNLSVMQTLIAGIMSGQVAVQLADSGGTAVITRNGADITAVKKL